MNIFKKKCVHNVYNKLLECKTAKYIIKLLHMVQKKEDAQWPLRQFGR